MSRQTKQRKLNNTIAVIADGQTEKWYLENVKAHYRHDILKGIRIEPQLPQKKQIEELVNLAKGKVQEGYPTVILIIDFDEILANVNEFLRFKQFHSDYCNTEHDNWITNVILVVNQHCLEYCYLLHFKQTDKFYSTYDDLKNDLTKQLLGYAKSKDYYCSTPDIFTQLGGEKGLSDARNNAKPFLPFDIRTCREKGVSEMSRIFDYFDSL